MKETLNSSYFPHSRIYNIWIQKIKLKPDLAISGENLLLAQPATWNYKLWYENYARVNDIQESKRELNYQLFIE